MVKKKGDFLKTIYLQNSVQKLDPVFGVPKVKTYILMVYDGTGSSLNNSLLSSSFVLSTIDLVFRGVELGSYFGDNDLGELFF